MHIRQAILNMTTGPREAAKMAATIPFKPEFAMSTAVSTKSSPKPAQVLKDADFNWEDPLGLEGDLTEEERMVRDSARAFSQDKLMPRVRLSWRDEKVDKDLLPEMARSAFLARPSRRSTAAPASAMWPMA